MVCSSRRWFYRPIDFANACLAPAEQVSEPFAISDDTLAMLITGMVPSSRIHPELPAQELDRLLHQDARDAIDEVFGGGFAREHADLVRAAMQLRRQYWIGDDACAIDRLDIRLRQPAQALKMRIGMDRRTEAPLSGRSASPVPGR